MPEGIDLAYIAGLIDGEGSVGIYYYKTCQWQSFGLNLTIRMCDREGLDFVQSLYGGNIRLTSKGRKRPIYTLKLNRKPSVQCLKDILLYLKVKRRQAETALAFQKSFDGGFNRRGCLKGTPFGKGRTTLNKVPEDIIEYRKDLIKKCKELKRA